MRATVLITTSHIVQYLFVVGNWSRSSLLVKRYATTVWFYTSFSHLLPLKFGTSGGFWDKWDSYSLNNELKILNAFVKQLISHLCICKLRSIHCCLISKLKHHALQRDMLSRWDILKLSFASQPIQPIQNDWHLTNLLYLWLHINILNLRVCTRGIDSLLGINKIGYC